MNIGMVLPALPLPVVGYGGIEPEALYLAAAMTDRGHKVTVYGNFTDLKWKPPFYAMGTLPAEHLVAQHAENIGKHDVVWDWTHTKICRTWKLKKYFATTMWTDVRAQFGRDIYPSAAVRDAFKDSTGPVIPLGFPCEDWKVEPAKDNKPYYLAPLRMIPLKGVDHAINLWSQLCQGKDIDLIVAGFAQAPFGDPLYAMAMKRMCADTGAIFEPSPSAVRLRELFVGATGVLHPHRWLESFSLAAAEALCLGVPVLTTDTGGTQEIVRAVNGGAVTSLTELEAGHPDADAQRFFDEDWSSKRAGIAKRAKYLLDIRLIANRYERLFEVE